MTPTVSTAIHASGRETPRAMAKVVLLLSFVVEEASGTKTGKVKNLEDIEPNSQVYIQCHARLLVYAQTHTSTHTHTH